MNDGETAAALALVILTLLIALGIGKDCGEVETRDRFCPACETSGELCGPYVCVERMGWQR